MFYFNIASFPKSMFCKTRDLFTIEVHNDLFFFKTVRKEKRDRKVAPTTARVRKRKEKRDRKDGLK